MTATIQPDPVDAVGLVPSLRPTQPGENLADLRQQVQPDDEPERGCGPTGQRLRAEPAVARLDDRRLSKPPSPPPTSQTSSGRGVGVKQR